MLDAFSMCSDAKRLQELSDALSARDLLTADRMAGDMYTLLSANTSAQAGCQQRLFSPSELLRQGLIASRRASESSCGRLASLHMEKAFEHC